MQLTEERNINRAEPTENCGSVSKCGRRQPRNDGEGRFLYRKPAAKTSASSMPYPVTAGGGRPSARKRRRIAKMTAGGGGRRNKRRENLHQAGGGGKAASKEEGIASEQRSVAAGSISAGRQQRKTADLEENEMWANAGALRHL